jgi:hypothetical protein
VHPVHLAQAEDVLADVDPRQHGLGVIAFVVRALPRGMAAPADDWQASAWLLSRRWPNRGSSRRRAGLLR